MRYIVIVLVLSICCVSGSYAQRLYVAKVPGCTGYALPSETDVRFDPVLGCTDWSNENAVIEYNIRIEDYGPVTLRLMASNGSTEASTIAVKFAGQRTEVNITPTGGDQYFDLFTVGNFDVPYPGFYTIRIFPEKKTGPYFPGIKNIQLAATFAEKIDFSLDPDRKSAQVLLNYKVPKSDINSFYVESTIPADHDYSGTEITAIGNELFEAGLGHGEEGKYIFLYWKKNPGRIQPPLEWSQFRYMDIDSTNRHYVKYVIPYQWKVNAKIPMSIIREPDTCDGGIYWRCKIFNLQKKEWYTVASFKDKSGKSQGTEWYSSLRNTDASSGNMERIAYFQKATYFSGGKMTPATSAIFSYDYKGKYDRSDYGAGLDNNRFWLSTGGFYIQKANYGACIENKNNDLKIPDNYFALIKN
jgi:hypothetical protein